MYNEVLLDHNMHPLHKGATKSDKKVSLVNASCGDKYNLFLRMDGEVIVEASFDGQGCAISQASIDMMIALIIGKSLDEAATLAEKFGLLIQTGETQAELGEANALVDVSKMPARVKCAELAWSWLNR